MSKKILLVDDSETILMMEKLILTKKPYQLITAKNGCQAIERAEADQPDLILMDVVMPTMDGLTACQEIRNQPSTHNIPIIMVTTRGEEEYVETGYLNGCNDYITKPIDRAELLSTVEQYLGE